MPNGHDLYAAARDAGDDIGRCLALAARFGAALPWPGEGRTADRWTALARCAAGDLTAARVLEPHADALAILHEAGSPPPHGTWGVFAAEAPGVRVEFRDGRLHGTKPWCSLGNRLDGALVTAFHGDHRQLFAVELGGSTVRADPPERWVSRGLANVTSAALHFDGTPARPVGDVGWYLRRPGFAWGGIGVAACWYGGAIAVAERLRRRVAERAREVDARQPGGEVGAMQPGGEVDAMQLGFVDVALAGARHSLRYAAAVVDAGAADVDFATLALQVRSTVAAAAETVLQRVGRALGPTPLAFDEEHARRVADLQIYLRQHHGERDLAALGGWIASAGSYVAELLAGGG